MTENESANWNFQMYRHNGPRPRPSLYYTKYGSTYGQSIPPYNVMTEIPINSIELYLIRHDDKSEVQEVIRVREVHLTSLRQVQVCQIWKPVMCAHGPSYTHSHTKYKNK